MYQTIVLGLGFLVFFGGVYLIEHTDKQGILTSSNAGSAVVNAVSVIGTYVCDTDSGCKDPVTLMVSNDGNISMQTSFSDGAEIMQESGVWQRVQDGRIVLYVTGNNVETYPRQRVISVRYVTGSSLAGLSYDTSVHKDWLRPVFRKQEDSNQ